MDDSNVFVVNCSNADAEKLYLYLAMSLTGLAVYAAKAFNVI